MDDLDPLTVLLVVCGFALLGGAWFLVSDMRGGIVKQFEARLDRTEPREPFPEELHPFALPNYPDVPFP